MIGKGTYGLVHKAKDNHSGQIVAIKSVKKAMSSFLNAKYILREVQILKTLALMGKMLYVEELPFISLLDLFVEEQEGSSCLCIVSEYVEHSLDEVLSNKTGLTE
mmetsp:Transcript_3863/g.5853  ORF Transcript_3863/g.5853 Transcript_3863/m.5853 type:complete len:105 (-) Transcript_3863:899-1213(-)